MLDRDLLPAFKCDPQRESLQLGHYFLCIPTTLASPYLQPVLLGEWPQIPLPEQTPAFREFPSAYSDTRASRAEAVPPADGELSRSARPSRAGGVVPCRVLLGNRNGSLPL